MPIFAMSLQRLKMAEEIKIIASNKKAYYDYQILEKYEAGLVLQGSEVKALREGKCNLKDGYARIRESEIWLIGISIGTYKDAGDRGHDPERTRKLLMHRYEIKKIHRKVTEKGITLVPLKIYFKKGIVKIEIGLATGKKEYDKRESLSQRDQERELNRLHKKYKIK
jgi:SsrA-binding protein